MTTKRRAPLKQRIAEADAHDIFWYLYPMLDSYQKETSEARRARALAEKYPAQQEQPKLLDGKKLRRRLPA